MLLELIPCCQIFFQGGDGRLEENSGHDGALVRLDGVEGLVDVQRSALIALAAPGKALGNTPLTKIEDAVWDKAVARANAVREVVEMTVGRTKAVKAKARELGISERQVWRLVADYTRPETVHGMRSEERRGGKKG